MAAVPHADGTSVGPTAWVLGGGGLLGGAVLARLQELGVDARRVSVPWGRPEAAGVLTQLAASLPAGAEVYWCAGAGVVGTAKDDLAREVAALETFLSGWRASDARSALFLASSAGGVYAGSSGAPFTETTVPRPLAAYGEAKLAAEEAARGFATTTGTALLVGRLSNLYGPGQDFAKPQGLISHLCRAHFRRTPLSIYVPADTRRDYIYVRDAAEMVVTGLRAVRDRGGQHVKIMASERSASIAEIIGCLRRITRRRPPVVFGASPNASLQSLDLRFRSVAWPDLGQAVRTPLSNGIAATLASVEEHLRSGAAAAR